MSSPTIHAAPRMNTAPPGFDPEQGLPAGFMRFFRPLHAEFSPRQTELVARRGVVLGESHAGRPPRHLAPSPATLSDWRIQLPAWCADQRNQMTGPADDAELVVKMLNSGAPGVMLDLEDSMANRWSSLMTGVQNIRSALYGELAYQDRKRGQRVGITPSSTVVWNRVRGLHLNQAGVMPQGEVTSASLFDLALIAYMVEPDRLRHPLCIYIPKTEAADEALWWRDALRAVATSRGWPADSIKCMALIESHPIAYQMEEFLYHLREHILGLNLGRWDYMASLIHFMLEDPAWVLPDRNTIPHDVPFFQRVRFLMADICHRRGALAIGGMTALYPSREDPELNARALAVLEQDKRNESRCYMDGAWTGHPDQNAIAVAQFPVPNQIHARPPGAERYPDLRPLPEGVGRRTPDGTQAAVRTVIRYRNGVLNGRGASLLDGYMEDLATDRIYRLMLAHRMQHSRVTPITDAGGKRVEHTPEYIHQCFESALAKLIAELPLGRDVGDESTLRAAAAASEEMILRGWFNPI